MLTLVLQNKSPFKYLFGYQPNYKKLGILDVSVLCGSSLTIVTKCNQNLGHVFFLVTQLLKMHINAWPLRILTFIF